MQKRTIISLSIVGILVAAAIAHQTGPKASPAPTRPASEPDAVASNPGARESMLYALAHPASVIVPPPRTAQADAADPDDRPINPASKDSPAAAALKADAVRLAKQINTACVESAVDDEALNRSPNQIADAAAAKCMDDGRQLRQLAKIAGSDADIFQAERGVALAKIHRAPSPAP